MCGVFLLSLEANLGFYCVEAASNSVHKDNMHGDLMKSVIPGLYLTYELLKQVDYEVYELLSEAPTHQMPHFALSWILTWFSHDLNKFSHVQLIFDACLS